MDAQSIRDQAAIVAKSWHDDWKIYLDELRLLTGLSFEQACCFDMVCTLRRIATTQQHITAKAEKHMDEEHGSGDTWRAE